MSKQDTPPPYTTVTQPGQPAYPTTYQPQPGQPGYPTTYQPQPGYPAAYPPAQGQTNVVVTPGQPGHYQQTTYTTTTTTGAPTQVVTVMGGNCPRCGIGHIREDLNVCAIIVAILCFPIGLLALLCLYEKRCTNCGASF